MSRRIALSVVAGVVVLGGAGAFALAYAGEPQPTTLTHSTARYTAPAAGHDGSLRFTTDVSSGEKVKNVKVLAWPEDSAFAGQGLTEKDMASVESAVCKPSGKDTVRCSYEVAVTREEAEGSPRGLWHVAVMATTADGARTLDTKAADFTTG
ncbi:DUF5707 domain-containing protein [Streptomyces sp. NPDC005576]|uniref:DUF5707 domain-containing protein n=1 Tax=unclassified Streptomyces TaxID=2593676 RepID=UPI0033C4F43A